MSKIGVTHSTKEIERCLPDEPHDYSVDNGSTLPVLTQGAAKPIGNFNKVTIKIIEGECNRCGYDRIKKTVDGRVDNTIETCNACGAVQKPDLEKGHVMKNEKLERIHHEEEQGTFIKEIAAYDVYDLEQKTGNPYISLINANTITRLNKGSVEQLTDIV